MTEDQKVCELIPDVLSLMTSYYAQQHVAHVEDYYGWQIEVRENKVTGDFTIANVENDEEAFSLPGVFDSIEEAIETAIETIEEEF